MHRGARWFAERGTPAGRHGAKAWWTTHQQPIIAALSDPTVPLALRAASAIVAWTTDRDDTTLSLHLQVTEDLLAGGLLPIHLRVPLLVVRAEQLRQGGGEAELQAVVDEAVLLTEDTHQPALRALALVGRATSMVHAHTGAALCDTRRALTLLDGTPATTATARRAHTLLAMWAPTLSERKEALRHLRSLDPADDTPGTAADRLYTIATVLSHQGLCAEAIDLLADAETLLAPDHTSRIELTIARANLLLCALRLDEAEAAVRSCEQDLTRRVPPPPFLSVRVHLQRFNLALLQDKPARALPALLAVADLAAGSLAELLRGFLPLMAVMLALSTGELVSWRGGPLRYSPLVDVPVHDPTWLQQLVDTLPADSPDDPAHALRAVCALWDLLLHEDPDWAPFVAVGASTSPSRTDLAGAFSAALWAIGVAVLAARTGVPLSTPTRRRVDDVRQMLLGAPGQPGMVHVEVSLRMVAQVLEGLVADCPAPDAVRTGDLTVLAQQRPRMYRLLRALQDSATPLSASQLIDRVWAGERMRPQSARTRLYTLISQARRLGADIKRTPRGYHLAP